MLRRVCRYVSCREMSRKSWAKSIAHRFFTFFTVRKCWLARGPTDNCQPPKEGRAQLTRISRAAGGKWVYMHARPHGAIRLHSDTQTDSDQHSWALLHACAHKALNKATSTLSNHRGQRVLRVMKAPGIFSGAAAALRSVSLLLLSLAVCRGFESSTLVLRNGVGSYNQTADCEISTQYIDAWNSYNGGCSCV